MKREKNLKWLYPHPAFYHLWYLGVKPALQQKGSGTKLLQQILREAKNDCLPIYLETSEPRNYKWYEQHGFELQQSITINDSQGYVLHVYKNLVK